MVLGLPPTMFYETELKVNNGAKSRAAHRRFLRMYFGGRWLILKTFHLQMEGSFSLFDCKTGAAVQTASLTGMMCIAVLCSMQEPNIPSHVTYRTIRHTHGKTIHLVTKLPTFTQTFARSSVGGDGGCTTYSILNRTTDEIKSMKLYSA